LSKYTLVITEKPIAAQRVASALDDRGKPKKIMENGVPYYEAYREKKIVIVPAMGHLYTVSTEPGHRGDHPVLSYEWVPRYKAERGANRIRAWVQTISKLAMEADVFIDACDYDIEGSIIGYCILKYACDSKENLAKRMKYSTLTDDELRTAYSSLLPHLDFNLIDAGLARHEIDWLYGINLSRALTNATKKFSKKYVTLSTGRVQGPTLNFLATRERNIACFVPLPFWSIKAKARIGEGIFEVEYEKEVIDAKQDAEAIVTACRGKTCTVEKVETKGFQQAPPPPFDLGTLQSEAYPIFGYTPMHTSNIAQRLYLDALISYPRTSSQKLPPSIGYEKILKKLAKNRDFARLAGYLLEKPELKPTEGEKQDPAHPAIYPTGNIPGKILGGPERNVYSLVVHRFMATFGEPAMRQNTKISLIINKQRFFLKGKATLEEGWFCFYEGFVHLQDRSLPPITEGESVRIQKITVEEKFTKPPPRYNLGSLLKKMEQGKIGTKATRAGIMQTLYDREYIREDRIAVTDLGLEVTDVLRTYCPSVVSVEFTRQLEEKMNWIQEGKETKQRIVQGSIEILKSILADLEMNEEAMGERLSRAASQAKLDRNSIGQCHTCRKGKLIIQHSKKTRKRFVGCTNYFKGTCKTAFPLPQKGNLRPSGKTCNSCGWDTVLIWYKGQRPKNLCFNPECPSKKSIEERV
jgi:DNA topoisomerase-1